jgi:uncharacterized GH25 family protein
MCVSLSSVYAAHPQAEKDVSSDRGSQGNQEKIKGDSTPKKESQDEKVDQNKLKEDTKNAREEFNRRNAKGNVEKSDTTPSRTLQNN